MPKEVNDQVAEKSASEKVNTLVELTPKTTPKPEQQITSQVKSDANPIPKIISKPKQQAASQAKPNTKAVSKIAPTPKPKQQAASQAKPNSAKNISSSKKPVAKKMPKTALKPKQTISNKKPAANPIVWENPSPGNKPEPIKKIKPTYKYVSKESLAKVLEKFIPKQFIPTDRFAKILGIIFMLVVAWALVQFPFDKLLSGDTDIIVRIGYPWPFLDLGILEATASPLNKMNLFLDMVLYLILSYAIDVTINFMTDASLIQGKDKKGLKPQVYKDRSTTLIEQILKPAKNIADTKKTS